MPKYHHSNWLALLVTIFLFFITTNVTSSAPTSDPKTTTSNVGSLKGNFQVTPTGQAHYSIPIDAPPGTAGMTPALSIVYDSASSNTRTGLLGAGFSLEGLTAITRCSSNKTQNGLIHGVDFTAQDRFCLNGEQLVAVKGNYGTDGTEYRTYIDSKTKIISYGHYGSGPASFKVWTKGGQAAEYGFTSDSQVKAQGKDAVAIWALNRIQDTVGNYLAVHYFKDEDQGSFYPTEINYTGNEKAKITPYNSIKFIYEERPDTKTTYQAGSKTTLDKRLKTIQVYQGTNLVYEYRLTYAISENTFRSRIISIQKCSGNGVCLPPTKFEWQTNEKGWVEAPSSYIPPAAILNYQGDSKPLGADNGIRFVDIAGNGLLGIVQHVYWNPNNIQKGAWINNGNGWESAPEGYIPPVPIVHNHGDSNPRGTDNGVRFVDFIGNGLLGMVQHVYWSPSNIQKGAWINNGNGWEPASEKYTPPVPIIHNRGDSNPRGTDNGVRFVDLTGNGVSGIVQHVYWNSNNVKSGVWINSGNGWEAASPKYIPPIAIVNNQGDSKPRGIDNGVRFVELASNGLLGMVQYVNWNSTNSKSGAWVNNGNGWEATPPQHIPPVEIVNNQGDSNPRGIDNGASFIDLTGSGLADMVQHVQWNPNKIKKGAWINTGDRWIDAPANYIPPIELINHHADSNPHGIDNGVRFLDFTGSGLLGIVQHVRWNSNNIKTGAWVNDGHGWKTAAEYIPPPAIIDNQGANTLHGNDNGVIFIDLTGSGLPDIIQYVQWNANNIQKGAWFNKAKKLPDYLISITDGFDSKITIDYESLSNKKVPVYTKEYGTQYPNMDWQGPMYVVYKTASETASNDTDSKNNHHITTYHYTGAKVNHLGLGFLGFHEVTTTDQSTGINTTTIYSKDLNLHNKGMPVATKTKLANGTIISSSQDTWELKVFGDGNVNTTYYSPYVKQSNKTTYGLDGSLLSTTTLEKIFDDYANPLTITVTIQDATTNETYTTITENTYHNDPQKWFIGELTAAKVTKTATSRATQIRTSSFSYDPETSLLMQTIAEPDDIKLALTTKYERDIFGNIISTTVSGEGIEPKIGKVKYDDYGRFTIQTTNPLKQSTYQTTDPRFGIVTESIDLNGLKTTYQYDDFARQVGQINPDDTKTDISYSWFDPKAIPTGEIKNALKNCSYVITSHTKNSTTQNEYYDVLNRKVATTTQNMDGRVIWQLTYYDELGRATQTTSPFFAGDPIYYTKMQYDILGRVVKSMLPDGNSTQIIYDRFTTTAVNQLKQKQIKQVNALGELIKTVDNLDSATAYKYDAYSNLTTMIDNKGNFSKVEYDHLGRKTAVDDKDKGYWTYQYDVLGNLISQTDALKHTTTFKYDKLGRMISRTEYAGTDQASTSTWEYDSTTNGIGKLAKVNSVVDDKDQATTNPILLHRARYNGTEAHTRNYSYDSLGRIAQETTVITATNKIYTNSYVYDTNSRVAIETYPNGLQVKNSYNELGYLVQISDIQTGKVYWSLNAKDAAGHIISESHSNGLITNYTYDPKTNFLTDIDTVLSIPLLAQKNLLPELTGITATHQHIDKNNPETAELLAATLAVQKETFNYDPLGNIKTHQDAVNNSFENYQYDELNRLIKTDNNGKETTLSYDTLGNITYKSDVGLYKYGENGAGHHAVTSIVNSDGKQLALFQYNANGDQVSGSLNGNRNIAYTSYSKPLTIKAPKADVSFLYDANQQKLVRIDKTATTYYLGNYEEVITDNGKSIITEQKAYIGPNTIHIKREDSSDSKKSTTEIYEALHNNLGSVTDIIDANANVIQHFSYSPFGEQKQTKGTIPSHPITNKGFTGHETIVDANLIHMEGRIYDPIIGRFLSADPLVQDPSNSQCLNRYSYCINNPLAFTDPTGFSFLGDLWDGIKDIASAVWDGIKSVGTAIWNGVKSILKNPYVATAIGIAIGAVTYGLGFSWVATAACMSGYSGIVTLANGGSLRDAFLAAGLTFATAAIWHGTGDILSRINSTGFDNFVGRTLTHGMVGGGIRALEGGSFKDGFLAAAVAEALPIDSIGGGGQSRIITIAERTAAAGVVGGTVAAAAGGNFSNGATTAAYAQLFNDSMHEMMDMVQKPLTPKELAALETMDSTHKKPTIAETLENCGGQLMHDHTFQGLLYLSAPIPKNSVGEYTQKGTSRYTTALSMLGKAFSTDKNIPRNIRATIKTSNVLFKTLSIGTSNILRGAGRIMQKYALPGYAVGYMGACIYDQQAEY